MATDFTLTDQYDSKFRLSQFRGEDVLLLGCDKDSIEQGGAWQNLFREQYAQRLRILPIVNVSGLPRFARWFLKGRMKAALRGEAGEPKPPSILLDWDSNVSKRYGMRPQTCTVVLIDRAGQVRFVQPLGQIDEVAVQATLDMINQQMRHEP
ncbi:redoxin domain-containing protein [Candidatus Poribacteria bacterium]|nr:redoxin domain-containing protein [Candidatus Poribacteria bacterium]